MYSIMEDYRSFLFTNGTLQLEKVQREDAGNFTCFAENDQNNVSIVAHLFVKGGSRFPRMHHTSQTGYESEEKLDRK